MAFRLAAVGILAMIAVAANGCSDRAVAFEGQIESYLERPANELVMRAALPPEAIGIDGKIVPVDRGKKEIHPIINRMSEDIAAASPDEVRYVMWIDCEAMSFGGKYEDGVPAKRTDCLLTLIDHIERRFMWADTVISYPPTTKRKGEYIGAPDPTSEILKYLASLPRGPGKAPPPDGMAAHPTPDASVDPNPPVSPDAGAEKRKPAAGKANLRGMVFFNSKPAVGVEVRLCEKMSTIMGIECEGKIFRARTDPNGDYLIANVPPMEYEGVAVRVFNTNRYVFLGDFVGFASKYTLAADQTYQAGITHLFKSDIRITSPKNGASVNPDALELSWNPYPDAAYYTYSVTSDDPGDYSPNLYNVRTDQTSVRFDPPLRTDAYRVKVEAFNGNGIKIAELPDSHSFYVRGG